MLRRYRAERLLREQFEGLRDRVLEGAGGRLRARGVRVDRRDLEASYSLAWQGLYAALLDGQEIENPAGWLAVATFRRAIDEQRARDHLQASGTAVPEAVPDALDELGDERDMAEELDNRARLRQLFEGLRGGLTQRELQAATLCYLHGLTRPEAARRMGVSEARMNKLMDGNGNGRRGVVGKVGALVETISRGGWCEEQGSLMRGLAYGILDPEGERYRLAQLHRSQCPACRAYVLSLRGLAATLPPVPSLLHLALGAGGGAGVGVATASATGPGAGGGGAGASGSAAGASAGVQPGPALGGALTAGAGGAAGGGWALAGGSVGAKLAMGCLIALSFGAGCVALSTGVPDGHAVRHDGRRAQSPAAGRSTRARAAATIAGSQPAVSGPDRAQSTHALTPAARASREFGPEQDLAGGEGRAVEATGRSPVAASAATDGLERSASGSSGARRPAARAPAAASASRAAGEANAAAEREFGIG